MNPQVGRTIVAILSTAAMAVCAIIYALRGEPSWAAMMVTAMVPTALGILNDRGQSQDRPSQQPAAIPVAAPSSKEIEK